jgi:acetyl-CoA carboxylase biotin carboxyl carrier protein
MNIKDLRDLILTIDKTSITKLDLELDNLKLSVSKEQVFVESKGDIISRNVITEDTSIQEEVSEVSIENNSNEDLYIVKAPIMGTFYSSSSPTEPSFVKVGDTINEGSTLCILEAMKLMNEVQSDVKGEIVEVLVKNEDLVEYDQPIFKIRLS